MATGLTGAWVRTVQGLIFLIAIIFYLYADEPQRRARFSLALRGHGIRPARTGRDKPRRAPSARRPEPTREERT